MSIASGPGSGLNRARSRGKPGPKPLLEPEAERIKIIDAAHRVMSRRGFDQANLREIVIEAGLSNRAFYRHFASRDELLLAMYRRDVASMVRRLWRVTQGEEDPILALVAYANEYLTVFFEPEIFQRVLVMTSESAQRAAGYAEENRRLVKWIADPLIEVLKRGSSEAALQSASPEDDAFTICAVLRSLDPRARTASTMTRGEAIHYALRFFATAIGLDPGDVGALVSAVSP